LRWSFTLVFRAAVGAKVPGDVIVEIDPSRQNGQPAEIIESGALDHLVFGILLRSHNLSALNNDQDVVQGLTFTVEHRTRANYDRLLLGGSESIRDFIAFPKNNSGRDVMLDAPSSIDEKQLKELSIMIDRKNLPGL